MLETTMEGFIDRYARISDLCSDYKKYSKDVQQSLKNVYIACWRFDLRKNQILHVLNECLKPFEKVPDKKKKEEENLLKLF